MSSFDKVRERWAIKQLVRYQRKPKVMRVTEKYGDLLYYENPEWHMVLSFTIVLYAANQCTQMDFQKAIKGAAKDSGIPLADMKIIARYQQLLIECALIGSGQAPIIIDGGKL